MCGTGRSVSLGLKFIAHAPPEHLRPKGTFAFESLYAKKGTTKVVPFLHGVGGIRTLVPG